MRKLLLLSALALGACATNRGPDGGVVKLSYPNATMIVGDMISFTDQSIKAGSITVTQNHGDTEIYPSLVTGLNNAGFTVTDHGKAEHHIQYAVTEVGKWTVLNMRLDDSTGARLYIEQPDGILAPAGPFSRQTAEAE